MRSLGLDELVGEALVQALGSRLADVELRIAKLIDEEAKGSWKASIDLKFEVARREKISEMLDHAMKQRGGRHGA
jgi:hypothetical protein